MLHLLIDNWLYTPSQDRKPDLLPALWLLSQFYVELLFGEGVRLVTSMSRQTQMKH